MFKLQSTVATVALMLAALGCSSQDGSGEQQQPQNSGGSAGSGFGGSGATGSGCSASPNCGGCKECFTQCVCQTGDSNTCVAACMSGGGAGGSGGSSGSAGVGGAVGGSAGVGGGTGGSGAVAGSGGSGGAPSNTVQIQTMPFSVGPGEEVVMCQNFVNPFGGKDVIFYKTESFMTPGSHHMFVAEGLNMDDPLKLCSGLEPGTATHSVHSAQTPQVTTEMPPGVGIKLSGQSGIRVAAHYLNTTSATLNVDVTLLFYIADPATITQYAAPLFANDPLVYIPAHSPGTAGGNCFVPHDANLLFAVSHMHKHATGFTATANGQVIYQGTDWDEPQPNVFAPTPGATLPEFKIPGGSSVNFQCTYQNDENYDLTFGDSAATNEMCILSSRYFPAPDGQPIDCSITF